MQPKDDRVEFENHRAAQAKAMGADANIFAGSVKYLLELDKYDYSYLWSWMGVPIIQMPADIMATQEVVWDTKPDVIVETGVARGGSVLFMASLLQMLGKTNGKIIAVDIDIRAHNRESIEKNPLSNRIVLIQGSSTDPSVLAKIKAEIPEGARVMVVLDSDHSREHVLNECRAYGDIVTPGCYMIVADTMIGHVQKKDSPVNRSKVWFKGNDPLSALNDYMMENDSFEVDEVLNGKLVLCSAPGGYIRRKN